MSQKGKFCAMERDLSHIFNVSVSTVSDVVITWANYLYILFGSLPVWPSKVKVKQHLPESFKGRYENVRGILDCTKLKCELPKDYQRHSEMYSDTHLRGWFAFHPVDGLPLLVSYILGESVTKNL